MSQAIQADAQSVVVDGLYFPNTKPNISEYKIRKKKSSMS
jgi:hypothetical protein